MQPRAQPSLENPIRLRLRKENVSLFVWMGVDSATGRAENKMKLHLQRLSVCQSGLQQQDGSIGDFPRNMPKALIYILTYVRTHIIRRGRRHLQDNVKLLSW